VRGGKVLNKTIGWPLIRRRGTWVVVAGWTHSLRARFGPVTAAVLLLLRTARPPGGWTPVATAAAASTTTYTSTADDANAEHRRRSGDGRLERTERRSRGLPPTAPTYWELNGYVLINSYRTVYKYRTPPPGPSTRVPSGIRTTFYYYLFILLGVCVCGAFYQRSKSITHDDGRARTCPPRDLPRRSIVYIPSSIFFFFSIVNGGFFQNVHVV